MRSALAPIANLIAKFIAVILAVLFVITAVAALPLFNVGLHLFSPGVYRRALDQQGIYDRLPAIAAEQLYTQAHYAGPPLEEGGEAEASPPEPGSGPPSTFENLTQAGWEQFLSTLLPPEWLKAQTESALDQTFAILDSTEPAPEVTISLVEWKAHITGEAGVNAFVQLVRVQPPCSQDELRKWVTEGVSELPTCKPPDDVLAAATPQIRATLNKVVADLPDEAGLSQVFKGGGEDESGETPPPDSGGTVQGPLPFLQTIRLGARLSPLIPLVLLLLVALFAVRSWRGLMRWWGIPLLLAGLIGAALAVAFLPAMKFGYVTFVAGRIPPYLSDGFVQAGLDVAWQIAGTLAGWVGGEAALVGLVGLTMLAALFFVRERQNQNGAPAAAR
ncbi:MAG: hypothetical protein HW378_3365 [Anaerolineales bacterium]|nr:hypothetical protein [Anaerolineales bacterium]